MKTDLYWIAGPWPGRLAIMARPRGGDWLNDEVSAWRQLGIGVVISALETSEIEELDLKLEQDIAQAGGISFLSFPIPDREVPDSVPNTADFMRRVEALLLDGKSVAIHCRQGIGRSALLAACLLVQAGTAVDVAFERIAAARGRSVPDTREQREWVARFARSALTASSGK